MRWLAFVALVLSGCDYMFRLDEVEIRMDGSATDGTGSGNGCMTQVFHDSFDTTTAPCGPWGSRYGPASYATDELAGVFKISTTPASASFDEAGCLGNAAIPFDAHGLFIEVDSVFQAPGSYTELQIQIQKYTTALEIVVYDNTIHFSDYSGNPDFGTPLTYLPTVMKFWRMRPDPAAQQTVAEYSDNAADWHELGRTSRMFATAVYANFGAGFGGPAGSDVASFRHLNECP